MGTYRKKMICLLSIIVAMTYNYSLAQSYSNYYSLEQVDSLLQRIDSIKSARLQEDIKYFLDTGKSFKLLADVRYYQRLREYSQLIRDSLFECYKKCKGSENNRRVLGLLDLPQYMIDSLFDYKYTELEVRAGLGDTIAEQKIIEDYRRFLTLDVKTDRDLYKELYRKKFPEALLAYIGSEKAVKVFLEGLNSTTVFEDSYGQEPYNKISLFYYLLGSYSSLMPDIPPIISHFYLQRFLYSEEGSLGEEYQLWLRKLEEYFYEKHGVKLHIRAPYLIQGYEYIMEH